MAIFGFPILTDLLYFQTTPHMHTHNLSQHVHRIGIHFPSAIVAAVCMERGLYVTTTGKVVPIYGVGSNSGPDDAGVSQITINTEARDALKDLFPNIPDNDLNQIIKTAFQRVRDSFLFLAAAGDFPILSLLIRVNGKSAQQLNCLWLVVHSWQ